MKYYNTFKTVILFVFSFLGAVLSRWHGGGFHPSPKIIKNIIFALFPTLILATIIPTNNPITYGISLTFCFAVTLALKAAGHGKFFDLGTWKLPAKDESIEFLIKPLWGKIPEYWYDVLGMTLKGFLMSLGMVVPLLFHSPVLSLPILVGGIALGPAYMIGWHFFEKKHPTEVGEYLSGFFFYLGAGLAWFLNSRKKKDNKTTNKKENDNELI